MDKDALAEISMQIILKAGDARYAIMQSLDAISTFDFNQAEQQLIEAKQLIGQAHHQQTEVIQSQAGGEHIDLDLLFIHAQDTLMTINTEWNMAKKLLMINEKMDHRLQKLEQANSPPPQRESL